MGKYIDAEKLTELISQTEKEFTEKSKTKGYTTLEYQHKAEGLQLALQHIDSLQQEQPKKRLIQVKCLYPYDESWQKNKVYTCEVWHHGDLNRDFWDVYYDYGKDPKYVQFPTIELLNEEFVIIQEESHAKQEQPEVDLEKEIEKYCRSYYNCNYPDQIQNDRCSPIMPHIVEAARHFYALGLNARKEG